MKVSRTQEHSLETYKLKTMKRCSFVVTFVIEDTPLTKAQINSGELTFPQTNQRSEMRDFRVKKSKLIIGRPKFHENSRNCHTRKVNATRSFKQYLNCIPLQTVGVCLDHVAPLISAVLNGNKRSFLLFSC